MTGPQPRPSRDEIARLGEEMFARRVKPSLRPEDEGKFVAIDVFTGEYEIDEDDYPVVMRLRARLPDAEIYLMRAGRRAAYEMRSYPVAR
jgi:hypothetical protein